MTGDQGFSVDPRGVVPRQNSGTRNFHLGNNATNLSRNSLISKVARHFGEAQPKFPISRHNRAGRITCGYPVTRWAWPHRSLWVPIIIVRCPNA